jgi:hypothetical protein
MNNFEQRFLAARDGDLSPHESWRRRKVNDVPMRFEVDMLKMLESLTLSDYQEQLLAAAESKATVAWFTVRFLSNFDDAIKLWSGHIKEYHEPMKHVLGQVAAVWNTGLVRMQTGLFHPDHKPPEDRSFLTLEQLSDAFGQIGYKR